MTLSGNGIHIIENDGLFVLIPLLVDDPLRDSNIIGDAHLTRVLIPLLVDDPLRDNGSSTTSLNIPVLIPLLVDDPLRVNSSQQENDEYES